MPTGWQTFPVKFEGGLMTNISPLQQGMNAPGSARALVNFEPSVDGGYKRILGYSKYSNSTVPPYGSVVVQGAGQTGTTLVLSDVHSPPSAGDTFTISGVTGTYTIATGGVAFNTANKTVTLTLTTSLSSSPATGASVTFANTNDAISGLVYFQQQATAVRNGSVYRSSGSGWTRINIPSYGTVTVNGGSQTGTTLNVSGLTSSPSVGDTFSIAGVNLVYAVVNVGIITSGAAAITISPALASSPANGSAITFRTASRAGASKVRFTRHFFGGTSCIVGVDGVNFPFRYDGTTFTEFSSAPVDVDGAEFVAEFKNHIFYGKSNSLSFSAPFTDNDFSAANGAGTITLPHEITGLIVFREQLIIFSASKIHRLTGDTVADFILQPITLDVGCTKEDTIQEVGGDIMFVAADGVRMLSATDRIGDFGLAVASRVIQSEALSLFQSNTSFCSCVVRGKSQYRVFGYTQEFSSSASKGIVATQFIDQSAGTGAMQWAELVGFKAYVVDSVYSAQASREYIIFANDDGYVYSMESGNSFDGANIEAYFSTPFFAMEDPRFRKTIYKVTTYIDPQGSIDGTFALRFDFDQSGSIQPDAVSITNLSAFSGGGVFGTGVFGTASYGGKLVSTFINQVVGSGNTVSLQYSFIGTYPPFSLDALMLEYLVNDRQ